jgi:hypothetical protein
MRTIAAVAVVACLGCNGSVNPLAAAAFGPAGDQLECYGDPDRGGVVCAPLGELWDCESIPNGALKCGKPSYALPDGGGGWTCNLADGTVTCTRPGSEVPGTGDWQCTTDGATTICQYGLSAAPPGGGTWTCSIEGEFGGVTCVGTPATGSGGAAGSGTEGGGSGTEGGGSGTTTTTLPPGAGTTPTGVGGSTTPGMCTHWYAAKWGTGGTLGGCDGIPGNEQDCQSIRDLLAGGLGGPFVNGQCTDIEPTRVGDAWVIALPANCVFLSGGVCGKYGGNDFLNGPSGTLVTVSMPVQRATGLSHFEAMWCCT